VLLRDGYACVYAEAERFIASFYSAIMNPLPQGSGFFSFAATLSWLEMDNFTGAGK
jgi:hypothetical protein